MTAGSLAQSGYPPALCIFGGTLAGLGIGAVNGTLIGYLGLSPIITTLAVLFALGGIVSTISGGYSIGPLSSSFSAIGSGTTAHIPNLVIFALIIALAAYVILDHTAIGMLLRGIGGSKDAVVSLGLPVQRIVALTYVASGGLAALAGVLQAANLDSASPASGSDLEFSAIASVIVGGVSVYGALGSVTGIVVGAVLISALSIVLVILHISGTMQPVFVGLILIAAVALDALRRRRMFRLRVQNHRDSVPAHNPTIDSNITAERPKDQSDE
jgi:ribose/xylose/arabinose/galactoside ABC-type transport system permease subunit